MNYKDTLLLYIDAAKKLQLSNKKNIATNCCGKELQALLLQADKGDYGMKFYGCINNIGALSALSMYQSGLLNNSNEHNPNQ